MNLHKGRIVSAAVLLVVIFGVLVFLTCTYTVSEVEQVVVTEFGRPVKVAQEPGLKFKKPFIQVVNRLEKRVLAWDGDPAAMPTKDKKRIFIDTWARWRIVDPKKFFTARRTVEQGQKTLDDLVDSAVRDVVGSYNLIEVVRSTNREMVYEAEDEVEEERPEQDKIEVGREKMEEGIREKVSRGLEEKYGMELVDVRIKRINYVETVRKTVYDRMKAERERIAARYHSEAEEQRDIILGDTNKQLAIIEGEGEEKSRRIRGEADAQAIKIYGEALSRGGEFYAFLRALDAYKNAFDGNTEIILTTDSPFLKFMQQELEIEAKAPKRQD